MLWAEDTKHTHGGKRATAMGYCCCTRAVIGFHKTWPPSRKAMCWLEMAYFAHSAWFAPKSRTNRLWWWCKFDGPHRETVDGDRNTQEPLPRNPFSTALLGSIFHDIVTKCGGRTATNKGVWTLVHSLTPSAGTINANG
uniref:Uncharacterized protein n=1 Tax=Eutreptiella gymnastica TaxID=73025 RepID=A0A7S1N3I2_9EUGL